MRVIDHSNVFLFLFLFLFLFNFWDGETTDIASVIYNNVTGEKLKQSLHFQDPIRLGIYTHPNRKNSQDSIHCILNVLQLLSRKSQIYFSTGYVAGGILVISRNSCKVL